MTKQPQRIHLSIGFGDAILPIINCDDDHQRVPLKPICDQIGVSWEVQRRKISPESYLWQRLGAEITTLKGGETQGKQGNPTHLCVRIDRVTAFLNTINPQNIRGMGNDSAADWLEAKHAEWDDALHAYETNGFACKPVHSAQGVVNMIAQIDRIKNPALKQIAAQLANDELGLEIPIGKQQSMEV